MPVERNNCHNHFFLTAIISRSFISIKRFFLLVRITSWLLFFFSREKKERNTFTLSSNYKYITALILLVILSKIFLFPRSASNTTQLLVMANIHIKARKSPYSGTEDVQVRFNEIENFVLLIDWLENIGTWWESTLEC